MPGPRMRATKAQHEAKAMQQAEISVCSILRDWIKGQGSAACGAYPAPTGCASSGTNNERTDK